MQTHTCKEEAKPIPWCIHSKSRDTKPSETPTLGRLQCWERGTKEMAQLVQKKSVKTEFQIPSIHIKILVLGCRIMGTLIFSSS